MSTFYLPVATPEMVAMAERLSGGREAKGKAAYNIIQCTDSGVSKWRRRYNDIGLLAGVAAVEKLYVLLHGITTPSHQPDGRIGARRGAEAKTSRGATSWVGGNPKVYTPETFALHLAAEKLDKQFIDLRLFCCYSGVQIADGPPNATVAKLLKDAMVVLGYNAIMVTGYCGSLTDRYATSAFEPNGKGLVAHQHAPELMATAHKQVNIPDGRVASLHKQTW